MIFCLRQLQKRALSRTDHCTWYLSTSDTIGRSGLWQLLKKYGCPEKFTTVIEALHSGMMANISVGGKVSESFSITNGVKQGCVLAPTLFSIFLSAMLDETFRDMGDASTYSPDRAKIKTTRILMMRELLFADDSALVARSAKEMQKIVDAFSDASKKFGLKINTKKTEVLYQPNSTRTREEDIMVDGNKLNSVLEFTYLGSTAQGMDALTMKYRGGWPRLMHLLADYDILWNNHHAFMRVKGAVHPPIWSRYGAEAWTVYRRQVKKLHAFMMRHLRLRIT